MASRVGHHAIDIFFLFYILRQYKFLIYKFTNSTMNLIPTLIKIDGLN